MKRLGCVSDREKPPLPSTSRDWQTSGGIAGVLDRATRAPRLISQETDLCAGVESGNMLWILVESWMSVTAGPEQKPLVLRRVMVALVSVGLFWCDWVLRWVQILSHSWLRMGCALLDYVSMRTDRYRWQYANTLAVLGIVVACWHWQLSQTHSTLFSPSVTRQTKIFGIKSGAYSGQELSIQNQIQREGACEWHKTAKKQSAHFYVTFRSR